MNQAMLTCVFTYWVCFDRCDCGYGDDYDYTSSFLQTELIFGDMTFGRHMKRQQVIAQQSKYVSRIGVSVEINEGKTIKVYLQIDLQDPPSNSSRPKTRSERKGTMGIFTPSA